MDASLREEEVNLPPRTTWQKSCPVHSLSLSLYTDMSICKTLNINLDVHRMSELERDSDEVGWVRLS